MAPQTSKGTIVSSGEPVPSVSRFSSPLGQGLAALQGSSPFSGPSVGLTVTAGGSITEPITRVATHVRIALHPSILVPIHLPADRNLQEAGWQEILPGCRAHGRWSRREGTGARHVGVVQEGRPRIAMAKALGIVCVVPLATGRHNSQVQLHKIERKGQVHLLNCKRGRDTKPWEKFKREPQRQTGNLPRSPTPTQDSEGVASFPKRCNFLGKSSCVGKAPARKGSVTLQRPGSSLNFTSNLRFLDVRTTWVPRSTGLPFSSWPEGTEWKSSHLSQLTEWWSGVRALNEDCPGSSPLSDICYLCDPGMLINLFQPQFPHP